MVVDMSRTPRVLGTFPVGPADLQWEDRAQLAVLDELPRVRRVAERWTTTLSAVIGIFGLAAMFKGRQDFTGMQAPYPQLIGAAFSLAALCALSAVVLAALAAQGSPRKSKGPLTGATYQSWSRQQAHEASNRLRYSRVLSVIAVVWLLLAAGIGWYAPTASTSQVLVVGRDGTIACGKLSVPHGGVVKLETSNGGTSLEMPVIDISTVVPVSSCP